MAKPWEDEGQQQGREAQGRPLKGTGWPRLLGRSPWPTLTQDPPWGLLCDLTPNSSPTDLATSCYFFPKREAWRRPRRAFCPQGLSPHRNPAPPEGPLPQAVPAGAWYTYPAPALYSEHL